MDFGYYVVRKSDMVILDGTKDMVSAVNIGQNQGCACLILQACVLSEVGQDMPEEPLENSIHSVPAVEPDVEIIED